MTTIETIGMKLNYMTSFERPNVPIRDWCCCRGKMIHPTGAASTGVHCPSVEASCCWDRAGSGLGTFVGCSGQSRPSWSIYRRPAGSAGNAGRTRAACWRTGPTAEAPAGKPAGPSGETDCRHLDSEDVARMIGRHRHDCDSTCDQNNQEKQRLNEWDKL